MEESIEIIKNRIVSILLNNKPSIYLFGSVVLEDFKLGWSDIDIICLTETKISDTQANRLLNLRQELLAEYNDNKYFRLFEGAFTSLESFINNIPDKVVYWGTSGQRITTEYHLDPFSTIELIENGRLIYGAEIRDQFKYPSKNDVKMAVQHHYETISKYGNSTGKSIYSAGWILDIPRCIYTLRTGKIIAKTSAGKWALDNNVAPDLDILRKVISIREQPNLYKDDKDILEWLSMLDEHIQKFADVLEKELLE